MEPTGDDSQIQETQENRVSHTLNKSCEACRARKIRCQPNLNSSSNRCVRCEKKDILCIFNAPNAKRRRKRTDTRIAALENELRSLRSRLEGNRETSTASASPLSQPRQMEINSMSDDIDGTFVAEHESETQLTFDERFASNITPDQHDESIGMDLNLDEITQQQLLNKFVKELSPHLPFIYVPPDTTAHNLRHKQEILLSAILAASAASLYPP